MCKMADCEGFMAQGHKQESNFDMYATKQTHWGGAEIAEKGLNAGELFLFQKYLVGKRGRILEGGAGSGNLSFHAETMGDFEIDAFDFVPQFIQNAKRYQKARHSQVRFFVADATSLDAIPDNAYDYEIYLGQVLSFVPAGQIDQAIGECYRKLKKDGILLLSLLNYDGRRINKPLSFLLKLIRAFRGESEVSVQELPWLHADRRFNFHFLKKGCATNHWFFRSEAIRRFENQGFHLVECKTGKELERRAKGPDGMLYMVFKK